MAALGARGAFARALCEDEDGQNSDSALALGGDLKGDPALLPQPREILREEYSSPSFEVEPFLLQHTQFNSLRDLISELKQWDDQFTRDLRQAVEEHYEEFLAVSSPLLGAKEQSEAVRLELLRFRRAVEDQRKVLSETSEFVKYRIRKKRAAAAAKAVASTVLWARSSAVGLYKLTEKFAITAPGSASDRLAVVTAAKRCVALASLASKPAIPASEFEALDLPATPGIPQLRQFGSHAPSNLCERTTALAASLPSSCTRAVQVLAPKLAAIASAAAQTCRDDSATAFELVSARAWLLELTHDDA